jgi:hypothetical protein
MPLEDEINARLRHLSEEIRAFRKNIDQVRRRDQAAPPSRADELSRLAPEPPPRKHKRPLK